MPGVSILIPAYNARLWIGQCIQSALDQSHTDREIIVFDDGSTDGTLDVIRAFGACIRIVKGKHEGGNHARNQLLSMARSEWVQYLDADDYLLPGKIADQVRVAIERDADVVYSPPIVLDEATGHQFSTTLKDCSSETVHYIDWVPFQTTSMLFRKSALIDVAGWNLEQPACQEHELLLRLIVHGKRFVVWNEPATVYRLMPGTVSRRDPLLTIRLRMDLTERMMAFLQDHGKLTTAHRKSLYRARMECARSAWASDPRYASSLARTASRQGRFWGIASRALPLKFLFAEAAFGFDRAERLAAIFRQSDSSV